MVKVRIVSGNQAGAVVEMSETEAQANVATGFAEYVFDAPARAPALHPRLVNPGKSVKREPQDSEG